MRVCVYVHRVCTQQVWSLAHLRQQVAVEDAEQGHGCAVEEQEIEGQQRRCRRGRVGQLSPCHPLTLHGQQGHHTVQHRGQVRQKHVRTCAHGLLDGTKNRNRQLLRKIRARPQSADGKPSRGWTGDKTWRTVVQTRQENTWKHK